MAVLSLLLGILSLLLSLAGFVLTVIPYAGVTCSALSVVSAVVGIVLGARAHSQARESGEDTTLPVVGLVANVMMFLGSLCLLATCGACNALISSSDTRSGTFVVGGPDGSVQMYTFGKDGGVQTVPAPLTDPLPGDDAPGGAPADAPPTGGAAEPAAPAPALPPPPMNSATPPTR